MRGWINIIRAGWLAGVVTLAGCAGLSSVNTESCQQAGSEWDCVKSVPAFKSLQHNNNPHRPNLPDAIARTYDDRHLSLVAADRKRRIETAHGIGPHGRSIHEAFNRDDRQRYQRIASAVVRHGGRHALAAGAFSGHQSRIYDRRWRVARQVMYLGGKPAAPGSKKFTYSSIQASTSEISFRSIADHPLTVAGQCDGAAEVRQGNGKRSFSAGEMFRFTVPAGNRNRLARRLSPGKYANACTLTITGQGGYRDHVHLARDTNSLRIDGRYDVCASPDPAGLPPLERAFFADRWLSQTCVMQRQSPILLSDPRDAFNEKVEMLLGQRFSDAFYDAGDPMAPIDFSRAPKLDLIYISYLDIKADFTGKILERLLRHHARQGTPIRILVTEILQRGKDRALFAAISADHPNVQLQEFRWLPARGSSYDERASGIYKTHHIKLLATLSSQKGASRMVIGGRNLHDGFLYKYPLDLSRYPELQNYKGTNGLSLNYYSNYADFDIAIKDRETVETVAAHFSTVWNRDFETNVSRPFTIQTNGGAARKGTRHFISVPYADGKALEQYYVELIDAAQSSIEIVNPYLNPPPAIEAAFERALQRGVKITIIARINLRGDLGGQFLTELNELFVEKYADRMEMYEYLEPDVVLHSKFFMIDERLSVISSTNFNHRSFIHDSENGMSFLDPAQYRRFKQVFEQYRAGSRRLTSDVDIPLQYRLLLGSSLVLEAL